MNPNDLLIFVVKQQPLNQKTLCIKLYATASAMILKFQKAFAKIVKDYFL